MPSTCLIQGVVQGPLGAPKTNAKISIEPDTIPLFVNGQLMVGANVPTNTFTDSNGQYSFSLPWPSVCDPSNVQFQILMPDGIVWSGVVPSVAGPLTLQDLKNLGWIAKVTVHVPFQLADVLWGQITGIPDIATETWVKSVADLLDFVQTITKAKTIAPTSGTPLVLDAPDDNTAGIRLVPGATPGPPVSGSHAAGELAVDSNTDVWASTASGTGRSANWKLISPRGYRLEDYFQKYGGATDGTTDSSNAVLACLWDWMNGGGGRIILPESGVVYCSKQMYIPHNGISRFNSSSLTDFTLSGNTVNGYHPPLTIEGPGSVNSNDTTALSSGCAFDMRYTPWVPMMAVTPGATTLFRTAQALSTIERGNGTRGYIVGDSITLGGFAPAGYNGTFTIASIPNPDQFTVALNSSGFASITSLGGIVTGQGNVWPNDFALTGCRLSGAGTTTLSATSGLGWFGANVSGDAGTAIIGGTASTAAAVNAYLFGTITSVSGNGSTVTFTAVNSLTVGQRVSVSNVVVSAGTNYNGSYTVATASGTQFTASGSGTGTYSSGGTYTTTTNPADLASLAAHPNTFGVYICADGFVALATNSPPGGAVYGDTFQSYPGPSTTGYSSSVFNGHGQSLRLGTVITDSTGTITDISFEQPHPATWEFRGKGQVHADRLNIYCKDSTRLIDDVDLIFVLGTALQVDVMHTFGGGPGADGKNSATKNPIRFGGASFLGGIDANWRQGGAQATSYGTRIEKLVTDFGKEIQLGSIANSIVIRDLIAHTGNGWGRHEAMVRSYGGIGTCIENGWLEQVEAGQHILKFGTQRNSVTGMFFWDEDVWNVSGSAGTIPVGTTTLYPIADHSRANPSAWIAGQKHQLPGAKATDPWYTGLPVVIGFGGFSDRYDDNIITGISGVNPPGGATTVTSQPTPSYVKTTILGTSRDMSALVGKSVLFGTNPATQEGGIIQQTGTDATHIAIANRLVYDHTGESITVFPYTLTLAVPTVYSHLNTTVIHRTTYQIRVTTGTAPNQQVIDNDFHGNLGPCRIRDDTITGTAAGGFVGSNSWRNPHQPWRAGEQVVAAQGIIAQQSPVATSTDYPLDVQGGSLATALHVKRGGTQLAALVEGATTFTDTINLTGGIQQTGEHVLAPTPVPSTVTNNLQNAWNCNEGSPATTTADSVGGATLTLHGSNYWTTGKLNNGLKFDGVGNYASTTITPPTSGTNTYAGWIYLTDLNNQYCIFGTTSNNHAMLLRVNPAGTVQFYRDSTSNNSGYWPLAIPSAGQWIRWKLVDDIAGGHVRLYINTLDQGQQTLTDAYNAPGTLLWGVRSNAPLAGLDWFNGSQDAMTIHTRQTTDLEEAALYNGGIGAEYPFPTVALSVQNGKVVVGQPSATAPHVSFVPTAATGAPVSGSFSIGDFVMDATGTIYVYTSGGWAPLPPQIDFADLPYLAPDRPSAFGWQEMTIAPTTGANTNLVPSTGVLYMGRIIPKKARTITKVSHHLGQLGGTGTLTAGQNIVGIWDSTGTPVWTSTDHSGDWSSTGTTGWKHELISTGYISATGGGTHGGANLPLTAGQTYFVGIQAVGTSLPRFGGLSTSASYVSGNTTNANAPFPMLSAGVTVANNFAASFTPSSVVQNGNVPCIGLA